MNVLLAPVPIVHANDMFRDMEQGVQRFAFGSNALNFFERNFVRNSEIAEDTPVYIYVSKTGEAHVNENIKQFGVFVRARLTGWVMGNNRGQYPKNRCAQRPKTAFENDQAMTLFWEIDNVEKLVDRIPISNFFGVGSKSFADNFVPQGPMLAGLRK